MSIIARQLFGPSVVYAVLLSVTATHATQIYRYRDATGVETMSHVLPPVAAQEGYQILDERSLRVIKIIPKAIKEKPVTKQPLRETAQHTISQEPSKLLPKKNLDNTLRASYRNENELHQKRDLESRYFQNQVAKIEQYLEHNQNWLLVLQSRAATVELNGQQVDEKLRANLALTLKNIEKSKLEINRLTQNHEHRLEKFAEDLIQLKALLQKESDMRKSQGQY